MATQRILVNNFYGGINNITAPHLLNSAQAVKLENFDILGGVLNRENYEVGETLISASSNIKYFNDGNIIDLGTDTKYKGVKVVQFQDYSYILHEGIPKQIRNNQLLSTIIPTTGLNLSTLAAGPEDLSGIDNDKIFDYTYYLTYENSAGFESPLYKLGNVNSSVTLNATKDGNIQSSTKITFNHTTGLKTNVYRLGGSIVTPALVFTIDENNIVSNTTATVTMNSNEATFSILDRDLTEIKASPTKNNPPTTFDHLTASRYGMAASKGNILYLSFLRPDAWDTFNSLELNGLITGITYTDRGILAFTGSNTLYYITGTNLDNLVVTIINEDIGCSSHKSLVKLRSGLIAWIFQNDIYLFNGSGVSNLTKGRYKAFLFGSISTSSITNSVALDNKYIIGTSKGISIVNFDIPGYPIIDYTLPGIDGTSNFLFGNIQIYTLNNITYLGYYKDDNSFNKITLTEPEIEFEGYNLGCFGTLACDTDTSTQGLVGQFGNTIIDFSEEYGNIGCFGSLNCTNDSLSQETGKYKSPDFVGNTADSEIVWHTIDVVHIGKVTAKIYINDILVKEEILNRDTKGVTRINYPTNNNRGIYTSVDFEIENVLYSYTILYEATPIP